MEDHRNKSHVSAFSVPLKHKGQGEQQPLDRVGRCAYKLTEPSLKDTRVPPVPPDNLDPYGKPTRVFDSITVYPEGTLPPKRVRVRVVIPKPCNESPKGDSEACGTPETVTAPNDDSTLSDETVLVEPESAPMAEITASSPEGVLTGEHVPPLVSSPEDLSGEHAEAPAPADSVVEKEAGRSEAHYDSVGSPPPLLQSYVEQQEVQPINPESEIPPLDGADSFDTPTGSASEENPLTPMDTDSSNTPTGTTGAAAAEEAPLTPSTPMDTDSSASYFDTDVPSSSGSSSSQSQGSDTPSSEVASTTSSEQSSEQSSLYDGIKNRPRSRVGVNRLPQTPRRRPGTVRPRRNVVVIAKTKNEITVDDLFEAINWKEVKHCSKAKSRSNMVLMLDIYDDPSDLHSKEDQIRLAMKETAPLRYSLIHKQSDLKPTHDIILLFPGLKNPSLIGGEHDRIFTRRVKEPLFRPQISEMILAEFQKSMGELKHPHRLSDNALADYEQHQDDNDWKMNIAAFVYVMERSAGSASGTLFFFGLPEQNQPCFKLASDMALWNPDANYEIFVNKVDKVATVKGFFEALLINYYYYWVFYLEYSDADRKVYEVFDAFAGKDFEKVQQLLNVDAL